VISISDKAAGRGFTPHDPRFDCLEELLCPV
jgi:hypothetical protein